MKLILQRLIQEPNKSFIVYHEKERYFSSPWHYHPEYELVLITKSTGKRIIGDHIGGFEEGDLVLIGAHLPHVYDNDPMYSEGIPGLAAEAIVIQFLPDFLGDQFFKAPELHPFLECLERSSRGLRIIGTTALQLGDQMKAMIEMDGLERLVTLLSIFNTISRTKDCELLASPVFRNHVEVSASERDRKVTEYIMKNFTDKISLDMVADVANMTPTNFCTFFKKYYRQTFVTYLNALRVGYSCKLLGEDDRNISDVAYESGYKNLSNFNRTFKKFKGVSPAEYRQSLSRK